MSRESCGVAALENGRFERFRTHATERVRCVEGVLWVTQDGVLRDFVLEAGESVEFGPEADITVSALAPSRFQVTPPLIGPRPDGWFSRIHRELGSTLRGLA